MALDIDLRRDAAFERLVKMIDEPSFVSTHMRPGCMTVVLVPHVRYLTHIKEVMKSTVGFDDVYFNVSTVTKEALRGMHVTFILMPPIDTLAPYQAKNVPGLLELFDHIEPASRRVPNAFTIY